MTEREKMLGGDMYDPFDPELVAARGRARDLCQALNGTRESEQEERRRILRDLPPEGGSHCCMSVTEGG
jgi:maltose O-acetyltransferase